MANKRPPSREAAFVAAGVAGPTEMRPTSELRPHPDAGLLPEVPPCEFEGVRADIERRGLLVPLEITAAGVLLDGHVRYRAASELGIPTVPVRVVEAADELEYMVLATLMRRHLSAGQKAAFVVATDRYRQEQAEAKERQLANLNGRAADVATLPPRGKTRALAAARAGVSERTLQDASTVQAADPALLERVKQGEVNVAVAARRVRQQQRDAALPKAPPLPDGPFDLIYADPPWRFGTPDSSRAVENHYPTMSLADILAMPIPAEKSATLFLWAVNSMLFEARDVLEAWGFEYVNHFVWVKDRIGLGQWNRGQHELLLWGRRGGFAAPPPERRISSVITAKRGRHSEKPAVVYELIERMYPNASKLELFSRGTTRPGWTGWGNQAEGGS